MQFQAWTKLGLISPKASERYIPGYGFHFYENAIAEGVSSKFSPNNPERHIAFWNYSALLNISRELSFKACIPLYRGASLAKPFLNLNVFDTTEPQISLYVELVK